MCIFLYDKLHFFFFDKLHTPTPTHIIVNYCHTSQVRDHGTKPWKKRVKDDLGAVLLQRDIGAPEMAAVTANGAAASASLLHITLLIPMLQS
jgi:hypothetical protein